MAPQAAMTLFNRGLLARIIHEDSSEEECEYDFSVSLYGLRLF